MGLDGSIPSGFSQLVKGAHSEFLTRRKDFPGDVHQLKG